MESNEKLSSQFIVVKKVNTLLEKRVIELEKSQAKAEQYSRRNNVEISGIPHEILDNNPAFEIHLGSRQMPRLLLRHISIL